MWGLREALMYIIQSGGIMEDFCIGIIHCMKKYRIKKNGHISLRLSASFTVENSFIMPFFVIVIMQMLFLSFYIHDVVIIKTSAVKMAVMIENIIEENGEEISWGSESLNKNSSKIADKITQIRQNGEKYIASKTICTKNIIVQIENGSGKIVLNCKGDFSFLLKTVGNSGNLEASACVYKNDPEDFIRMINSLDKLVR